MAHTEFWFLIKSIFLGFEAAQSSFDSETVVCTSAAQLIIVFSKIV